MVIHGEYFLGVFMFSYRRKLRSGMRTSLFGSASIDKIFRGELMLIIQIEEIGDPVIIYVERKLPFHEGIAEIGTLQPGEVWSIHLDGVVGVSAAPDGNNDSFAACSLFVAPFFN